MPSALPYVFASAFLLPGILALLIRHPRRSRVVGFGEGRRRFLPRPGRHIGTDGILLALPFLVQRMDSFSFNGFAAVPISGPAILSATFGFALLGFGTKAGIFPFHIWFPYAYPEALPPVSAIMSGVMIKMEIYGPGGQLIVINPAGIGCNVLVLSSRNLHSPTTRCSITPSIANPAKLMRTRH